MQNQHISFIKKRFHIQNKGQASKHPELNAHLSDFIHNSILSNLFHIYKKMMKLLLPALSGKFLAVPYILIITVTHNINIWREQKSQKISFLQY